MPELKPTELNPKAKNAANNSITVTSITCVMGSMGCCKTTRLLDLMVTRSILE